MFEALLILAAASAGQAADPLAEARAGKVQCVNPNRATKTCMGIGSYTVRPDGSFDSSVTIMIVPTPLITMEVRSSGKVENGQVCSVIHKADYDSAKLAMDGGAVNSAMDQAIRAQMGAAIAPLDGKKACSTEKADGDVLLAQATIDGVARPELTQKFIWVSPDEGYKIGQ